MKTVLSSLVALCLATVVQAKCAGSGFGIWPSEPDIYTEQVFLLEGYVASQDVIQHLGKKYPVYLQNTQTKEKITLNVIEICIGDMWVTQALLQPLSPLKEGADYELHIDQLDSIQDKVFKSFGENHNTETGFKTWSVNQYLTKEMPYMKGNPSYSSTQKKTFGCGPSEYLNIKFPVVTNNPVLVKVTVGAGGVKPTSISKPHSYYVVLDHEQNLRLGHGMCAGGFVFRPNTLYRFMFQAVDMRGKKYFSKRLTFKTPPQK